MIDILIKNGCKSSEEITVKKQKLEREEKLAKISEGLGIGSFIKLGIGEEKQNANEEPYVLAETLEALIGAIYLDSGYYVCEEKIIKWFNI